MPLLGKGNVMGKKKSVVPATPRSTEEGMPVDAIGDRNHLRVDVQENEQVGNLTTKTAQELERIDRRLAIGDNLLHIGIMNEDTAPLAMGTDHNPGLRMRGLQTPDGSRVEQGIPDPRRAEDKNQLGMLGRITRSRGRNRCKNPECGLRDKLDESLPHDLLIPPKKLAEGVGFGR
jgi:hypothetical protein